MRRADSRQEWKHRRAFINEIRTIMHSEESHVNRVNGAPALLAPSVGGHAIYVSVQPADSLFSDRAATSRLLEVDSQMIKPVLGRGCAR